MTVAVYPGPLEPIIARLDALEATVAAHDEALRQPPAATGPDLPPWNYAAVVAGAFRAELHADDATVPAWADMGQREQAAWCAAMGRVLTALRKSPSVATPRDHERSLWVRATGCSSPADAERALSTARTAHAEAVKEAEGLRAEVDEHKRAADGLRGHVRDYERTCERLTTERAAALARAEQAEADLKRLRGPGPGDEEMAREAWNALPLFLRSRFEHMEKPTRDMVVDAFRSTAGARLRAMEERARKAEQERDACKADLAAEMRGAKKIRGILGARDNEGMFEMANRIAAELTRLRASGPASDAELLAAVDAGPGVGVVSTIPVTVRQLRAVYNLGHPSAIDAPAPQPADESRTAVEAQREHESRDAAERVKAWMDSPEGKASMLAAVDAAVPPLPAAKEEPLCRPGWSEATMAAIEEAWSAPAPQPAGKGGRYQAMTTVEARKLPASTRIAWFGDHQAYETAALLNRGVLTDGSIAWRNHGHCAKSAVVDTTSAPPAPVEAPAQPAPDKRTALRDLTRLHEEMGGYNEPPWPNPLDRSRPAGTSGAGGPEQLRAFYRGAPPTPPPPGAVPRIAPSTMTEADFRAHWQREHPGSAPRSSHLRVLRSVADLAAAHAQHESRARATGGGVDPAALLALVDRWDSDDSYGSAGLSDDLRALASLSLPVAPPPGPAVSVGPVVWRDDGTAEMGLLRLSACPRPTCGDVWWSVRIEGIAIEAIGSGSAPDLATAKREAERFAASINGAVTAPVGAGREVTVEEIVEEWRAQGEDMYGGHELSRVLARHVGNTLAGKDVAR